MTLFHINLFIKKNKTQKLKINLKASTSEFILIKLKKNIIKLRAYSISEIK